MAQIALSQAGAVLGSQLLPNGVTVLGQQIAGQAIGRTLGAIAGRAIDNAVFAPSIEGPRLKSLHIMESREGAGIPRLYGRMRVSGQVIWAAQFRESRREERAGKGGPTVTEFRYSASFAVGIAEGEIARVDRAWANGEPLDLSAITVRIYPGSETQDPDPLIEAVEGVGLAPAYRGLAYIVFEDLPLGPFGNRLPQLSFEVVRAPNGAGDLSEQVEGVNIIPASGEFVYATDVIKTRTFPGIEQAINANSGEGRADLLRSLDQLGDELPGAKAAALTVAWFGDDLRTGHCRVRPGVETRDKSTVPYHWEAGDTDRSNAYLISRNADDLPNYGGTPADWSVIQAIHAMHAQGIAVTMSPFLLMDVPPGNGLPDPYGASEQAPFPWRGRITSLADATAGLAAEVTSFLGSAQVTDFSLVGTKVNYSGAPSDWGYRRFVLHLAWLCKAAGGVDGFLLGSELRGLTRLRTDTGAFPFVEGLVALADDVRTILGFGTTITYAADWTEYGSYAPEDGSGDVLFPLDKLWAHTAIDLVAIDWYPPAGDWRPGEDHLDAQAGFSGPGDPAYLLSQLEGGEGYDWYYATDADRLAQIRTPILDTAHGEDWVFRPKDLANWWNTPHHERPAGVRLQTPTSWVPGSKPVRLAEIGFPAVDLGPNSPNLFYDPKSSESAVPPFSSGARDDVIQRQALIEALAFYRAQVFVEKTFVWCWDARPYPAFPLRSEVWGDGENWQFGHWLNGRTGLAPLPSVVADIAMAGGADALLSDRLNGIVEGYAFDGSTTLRAALEPLRVAYSFDLVETGDGLVAQQDAAIEVALDEASTVSPGVTWTDTLLDASPGRLTLIHADPGNGYQPATVEARITGKDSREARSLTLPLALSAPEAERIAIRLLDGLQPKRTATVSVPHSDPDVALGAEVTITGRSGKWTIARQSEGTSRTLTLLPAQESGPFQRSLTPPGLPPPSPLPAEPELLIIDAPHERSGAGEGPLIAVAASPWPGDVTVEAGADLDAMTVRATLTQPAIMGLLAAPLPSGPVGRWDRGSLLDVDVSETALASASPAAVLASANRMLVETASGWELLAFRDAQLVGGKRYRLSGLLRGLQGTVALGSVIGAKCVLLDRAVDTADVTTDEVGVPLVWRTLGTGASQSFTHDKRQGLPWPVAHLRQTGQTLTWIRRGADISESWYLPESGSDATYQVRFTAGDGSIVETVVTSAMATIPPDAVSAAVTEQGADGRLGPWLSLAL